MFMDGTLRKHIGDKDKQAKARYDILMKQMLEKNPIDENLKDTNPLFNHKLLFVYNTKIFLICFILENHFTYYL